METFLAGKDGGTPPHRRKSGSRSCLPRGGESWGVHVVHRNFDLHLQLSVCVLEKHTFL